MDTWKFTFVIWDRVMKQKTGFISYMLSQNFFTFVFYHVTILLSQYIIFNIKEMYRYCKFLLYFE
jgi:hypothetical protein